MKLLALPVTFLLLASPLAAQDGRLDSARLDGDRLHLAATTVPQSVRHFPLTDPPRVVVDLLGIGRSAAEMPAPAASSAAVEVRTGEHPGFLRVVVDLQAPLPAYQVRQSGATVEIGLGADALPSSGGGALVAASPIPDLTAPGSSTPARVASRPVLLPLGDVAVNAEPRAPVEPAPVEAAPAAAAAEASAAPDRPAGSFQDLDELTTDELLALIEEELADAGLAEDLIDEVEAELDARPSRPYEFNPPAEPEADATPGRPAARDRQAPPDRRPPGERQPFRYTDRTTSEPPPSPGPR